MIFKKCDLIFKNHSEGRVLKEINYSITRGLCISSMYNIIIAVDYTLELKVMTFAESPRF